MWPNLAWAKLWRWTRGDVVGVTSIQWVGPPRRLFISSQYPFACDYWIIAVRSFFFLNSVFYYWHMRNLECVVFLAHTFVRVTTNKHSSVLCKLIGRVMDFTDSSRTEPNTGTLLCRGLTGLPEENYVRQHNRNFVFLKCLCIRKYRHHIPLRFALFFFSLDLDFGSWAGH